MDHNERDGFVVGDRVVLIADHPDDNQELVTGDEGVILYFNFNSTKYFAAVRWDKKTRKGHSCDDMCEDGYGWKVPRDYIRLAECGSLEPICEPDIGFLLA